MSYGVYPDPPPQLTDRLRHGEASLAGADEDSGEPDWLMQLRTRELGAQVPNVFH